VEKTQKWPSSPVIHWCVYFQPDERPSCVLNALEVSRNLGTFPHISTLLQIFATLPVTTSSSERSFSALKFIKNYLRSTMTDERLNGLALLFVHPLDYDAVIDEFGKSNRRLQFY